MIHSVSSKSYLLYSHSVCNRNYTSGLSDGDRVFLVKEKIAYNKEQTEHDLTEHATRLNT